ncbi:WD40/YVTN/BNR-like repeat-containing protein [Enterococcus crotali]|uniref:WD40/YVTN/BNR-like repeat-containing protein n=1 Tax=Enterococcus crotali TaxID=1453587 RepID=UPI00047215F7|nr:hypothetical protein [Enterococcus crotali]
MNYELLIIELLSVKEAIIQQYQKEYKHVLRIVSGLFLLSSLFFFGISTLVYQQARTMAHSLISLHKLETLYHLALGIGCLLTLIYLVIAFIYSGKLFSITTNFTTWLEKQAPKMLLAVPKYQDAEYYYLVSPQGKEVPVKKTSCRLLTTSLDDQSIMIGQRPLLFGAYASQIFVWSEEGTLSSQPTKKGWSLTKKSLLSMSLIALLCFAGIYYYLTNTTIFTDTNSLITTEDQLTQPTLDTKMSKDTEVTEQTRDNPAHQTEKVNDLYLNPESNELFMTTDSGTNWHYVPLQLEWLRGGDYTLTTGTIPVGYWMDKSFDISSDFSWFIFSPDNVAAYLLTSTDNGNSWQKNRIDDHLDNFRYRKATFFANGSGIAIFSTNGGMSAENISIYSTADQGKNWTKLDGTTVSQPIQNASYLSQATGFIATRTKLYYTNNYGRSFNEALINIPKGYTENALDIFQSPNEITEVSANTLEAKFNLLKTEDIDINVMFSCLFQSVDGGETWTFKKQVARIKNED